MNCDWARFRQLVAHGEFARALDLARDRPFGAYTLRQLEVDWLWVERENVTDIIVEDILAAARKLAGTRLAADDGEAAPETAQIGLAVENLDEELVRLAMQAADAVGDTDQVDAIWTELEAALEEAGVAPEPETRELHHQLTANQSSRVLIPFTGQQHDHDRDHDEAAHA